MKLVLFSFLGVVAVFVLVALSPLVLCYFLFDRLCDCIEEFRPRINGRRTKKAGGGHRELIKRAFAALSAHA